MKAGVFPCRSKETGLLPERRLFILSVSWQARSRAMLRLQSAIGCVPSAGAAWDKPEHRQKACGKVSDSGQHSAVHPARKL